MTTDAPQAPLLRHLEERLLEPEVRRSPQRVGDLLGDEFVEFGSSGRTYDKAQIIAALQQETPVPVHIVITEFTARRLAPEVVLVTYRTTQQDASTTAQASRLRSSIWKRMDGRWQMVFHQGTPSALSDQA